MIAPQKPENEEARLAALRSFEILDTLPEQAYDDLLRIAAGICGTPMGAITLIDADRQWFKARQGVDDSETSREVAFCGHAILRPEHLLVVPDAHGDERFRDNPFVLGSPGIRFYAGAPLVTSDGAALGTLCVFDSHPREMTPFQLDALRGLSRQVASLLELRRVARALGHHLREREWYEQQMLQYQQQLETHNADLAELSRADALTGLPNRRAFDDALAGSLAAAPSRRGVAVALVDIDHFKSINDLHGHPAGDEVIAAVAAAMRASAGPSAVVARYGGEEFAVLLADVDDSAAELQAEYLREAVQNLPIGIPVTVSVGVALRRTVEPVPALVERADRALCEAKRGGRNRVVLAGA